MFPLEICEMGFIFPQFDMLLVKTISSYKREVLFIHFASLHKQVISCLFKQRAEHMFVYVRRTAYKSTWKVS